MKECIIRPGMPADQAAAYYVCLKTGDFGKDGEPFYREDPDALGRIFVGPYLAYEPDLSLILEDEEGVCGYAFGAFDSKAFYARYEKEWRPQLCKQFPAPTGDPSKWTRAQTVYSWYHNPDYTMPEPYAAYPSHLHIDLMARAQGRGYGRRMIEQNMETLRRRGSPGAHLGVSMINTPAIGFYQRLGFKELLRVGEGKDGCIYMGKSLRKPEAAWNQATGFLNKRIVPALTALSENTYLSAIRAGMVSVVPLTIIGGLFIIVAFLPINGWDKIIAPYLQLLQVPVTATFGLLSVFVCFAIGYDLGKQFKQEAIVSATIATVVFLMIQLKLGPKPDDIAFSMDSLGSKGLFTAVLIALVCVRVQKFFTDKNIVIKLPENVPPVVYESFLSLSPLFFLVLVFWVIRFVLGVDIDHIVQTAFKPVVFALNTLPGILVYAFLVTLLWSVGINGDNAMDAIVAPIFLQYLAANVEAMTAGHPLPYVTAYGFFTAFVNVGGTGATIALALVMFNSKEPGYRKVSRLSLPTQIFQINEPIFFGFPIVLNPIFMVPYILNALILTASSFLLMQWGLIHKPFVNVPWTTPPIIGHYLVSGGDWRAAVWGAISIVIAMAIYYPFAKAAERQRLKAEAEGKAHE